MDKDFIENNNLKKILKNYLKQENLTISSKKSPISISGRGIAFFVFY